MAILRERERLLLESEAKVHRRGRAACRPSSGWAYLSGLCWWVHLWRWWGGEHNRGGLPWRKRGLQEAGRGVNSRKWGAEWRRRGCRCKSFIEKRGKKDKNEVPGKLTCERPGEGAGWGVEGDPVIGCGALFISLGSACVGRHGPV